MRWSDRTEQFDIFSNLGHSICPPSACWRLVLPQGEIRFAYHVVEDDNEKPGRADHVDDPVHVTTVAHRSSRHHEQEGRKNTPPAR